MPEIKTQLVPVEPTEAAIAELEDAVERAKRGCGPVWFRDQVAPAIKVLLNARLAAAPPASSDGVREQIVEAIKRTARVGLVRYHKIYEVTNHEEIADAILAALPATGEGGDWPKDGGVRGSEVRQADDEAYRARQDAPPPASPVSGRERWHIQTRLTTDDGPGDCVRACVASYFGLPIAAVPDFPQAAGPHYAALDAFFAARGYQLVRVHPDQHSGGMYLAAGVTERGTHHMVIFKGGNLLHDPHPSVAGLTELTDLYLPVPLDGAALAHPSPPEPVNTEMVDALKAIRRISGRSAFTAADIRRDFSEIDQLADAALNKAQAPADGGA